VEHDINDINGVEKRGEYLHAKVRKWRGRRLFAFAMIVIFFIGFDVLEYLTGENHLVFESIAAGALGLQLGTAHRKFRGYRRELMAYINWNSTDKTETDEQDKSKSA